VPHRRRRTCGNTTSSCADARVAFLYLIPAFAVMTIITFYPLLYQVWMSFTDFPDPEPEVRRSRAAMDLVRQLHQDPDQRYRRHPQLRFPQDPRV